MAGIPPKGHVATPRAVQAWRSYHTQQTASSEILQQWILFENPLTAGRSSPVLGRGGRPVPRLWFTHPEVAPVIVFNPQRYELVVDGDVPRVFTKSNYLLILLAAIIDAREKDGLSVAAEYVEYARLSHTI